MAFEADVGEREEDDVKDGDNDGTSSSKSDSRSISKSYSCSRASSIIRIDLMRLMYTT